MDRHAVTFSIYRSKTAGGATAAPAEGRFEEFTLEVRPHESVLDALERIRRALDPALIYRHSCHHGSCGTCACLVNGKERLACTTNVHALGTEKLTVEPLRKTARVGDIAVDLSAFFRELPPAWSYLRESEWNPGSGLPAGIAMHTRFESCIECGICVSACPVPEGFMGPAALAFLNRELAKEPEKRGELLEHAAGERGVGSCVRALECSRACPAGVYPGRRIADLRRELESDGR